MTVFRPIPPVICQRHPIGVDFSIVLIRAEFWETCVAEMGESRYEMELYSLIGLITGRHTAIPRII